MEKNICLFIPYHKDYHSIHTINFVLETKHQPYTKPISQSVYKVHYVRSGKGYIHIMGKDIELNKGDLFFTFPAVPFSIESKENFSYMYISFLGSRANMIMDKLKINDYNFIFHGCNAIYSFWENGLKTHEDLTDLIAESILLYTFTYLGGKTLSEIKKPNTKNQFTMKIKKYIDDNFSNPSLSLKDISDEFSYDKKYISSIFKKNTGIGISKYLNTLRIQHACTLISQGFTSISDIAVHCGYSDPQYFSKVFKSHTGLTPSAYIENRISR